MTRNPYAQLGDVGGPAGGFAGGPGGTGGPGGYGYDAVPARTSALAVASLVFALVCFIPGAGLLAVLLGVPALFMINASRGRVRGTGLAVTGVVVGLLVSAIWVIFFAGAAWANEEVGRQMTGPTAEVLRGIESGDRSKARARLSATANAAVTDADFDAFHAAYRAEVGDFQSVPQSLWDLGRGYMQVGHIMQGYQGRNPNLFPHPATFANGPAVVLVEFAQPVSQPPPGSTGFVMPPMENLGIVTPQGREIWLIPSSTGAQPAAPRTPPVSGEAAPAPDEPPPADGEAPAEPADQAPPAADPTEPAPAPESAGGGD